VVVHADTDSLTGEAQCDRATDAPACARYNGDAVAEFHVASPVGR
jgi:hypothetical protein